MIIVLVEDEPLVAQRLARLTREILGPKLTRLTVKASLPEAMSHLSEHRIDLLLLDLSLHGRDGFELLKLAVSGSFQTIVVTAHDDRAVEAFEYGVLDFLAKPVGRERLARALDRFARLEEKNPFPSRYVAVRKQDKLLLIEVDRIRYIRGAGIYSELRLVDGTAEIHDKSLQGLDAVLPPSFVRVHKSFLVDIRRVVSLSARGGSRYGLRLDSGEALPVGRAYYRAVKAALRR